MTPPQDDVSPCDKVYEYNPDSELLLVNEYQRGYPLQAAYQSSESSWSIYRGFSYLHARVILNVQEEIRLLEAQLEKLDMIHSCDDVTKKRLRSRRDDLEQGKADGEEGDSKRNTLLNKIRDKLLSYGKIPFHHQPVIGLTHVLR